MKPSLEDVKEADTESEAMAQKDSKPASAGS